MWNQDIDESHADGLWDMARDLMDSIPNIIDPNVYSDNDFETIWSETYYGLWGRANELGHDLLDEIDDKLFDVIVEANQRLGFNIDLSHTEQTPVLIELREIILEFLNENLNN